MNQKIVVACPHCGTPSTYSQRMSDGGQAETCRHCHKGFMIDFQSGDLRNVRK